MKPIGVLIVDDHAIVREGYRRLLERTPSITIVAEASSAGEAYQAFVSHSPDVVVMDISLPDTSGIEAARRILHRDASAKVLVFSIHDEPIFPERAFAAGARGYITKASAPDVLVQAIEAVARGEVFLSPDVAQLLAVHKVTQRDDAMSSLSAREFEVLRLLAQGESLPAIAERLCLNYKTIANYQTAIRKKLGAASTLQMLRIAERNGIVSRSEP